MELVDLYKRIHKVDNIAYITLESVIHRIYDIYKGRPANHHQMHNMMLDLSHEMESRFLDRYFQVELSLSECGASIKATVNEINKFNKPRECVVISN